MVKQKRTHPLHISQKTKQKHKRAPKYKHNVPHFHHSLPHTLISSPPLPAETKRLSVSTTTTFPSTQSAWHQHSLNSIIPPPNQTITSIITVPMTTNTATLFNTSSQSIIPKQQQQQQQPKPLKPLDRLTIHIVDTFNQIQKTLIAQQELELPDLRYDNEHFDYKIMRGEVFEKRYEAVAALGKGTFGQVVKCFDRVTTQYVALKIIKSKSVYTQQAYHEVEILERINEKDANDDYGIVRLLDKFKHRNHLCLVFELLSMNLFEVVHKFKSLSLLLIRKIAYQVLTSLYFLSEDGVNIIHGDLKPENILLRDPTKSGVKIVDFGSSCMMNRRIFNYIQSRFYRAPEILLELPYTQAIDMWSLGCILVELHTGEPLFAGVDERDQLIKIAEVLGGLPDTMLRSSTKFVEYFCNGSEKDYSRNIQRFSSRRLDNILGVSTSGPNGKWLGKPGHEQDSYARFIDLILCMLTFDPYQRIKPMEALHHPFFTQEQNWCDSTPPKHPESGKRRRPNSIISPARVTNNTTSKHTVAPPLSRSE